MVRLVCIWMQPFQDWMSNDTSDLNYYLKGNNPHKVRKIFCMKTFPADSDISSLINRP
jgi:hypothetical protein